MALISCKECKGQVSDQAGTCPHCGVAINKIITQEAQGVMNQIDTGTSMTKVEVELTNKKWKEMYLYSWLAFASAVLFFSAGSTKDSNFLEVLGVIFFIFALVLRYASKIGAWWNNR